jgi:hypothetical protein
MIRPLPFVTLVSCTLTAMPAMAQIADTIITNAKIYTVEEGQPWAEATAIIDGRFVKVGDADTIAALKGPDTKVVDLGGRFAMPGMIDAHIHPLRSQLIENVDFSTSAAVPVTPEQFDAKIKTYAASVPDKPWIIGAAFSWSTFTETPLNSAYLDAIVPDRPVVIEDETGHIAIANSKALEMAGITNDTLDPVGGYFGRTEDGAINGLLYETAMQEVFKHSPNYAEDDLYQAATDVMPRLSSMGITGIKVAQGDENWVNGLKRMDEEGLLKMQVSMTPYEVDFYRLYSNEALFENPEQYETDHVRIDGVKLFADGVPFGRTMLIKETYPGTDYNGLPMTPPEKLRRKIVDYNARGFGVMVHSTGDRGTEIVLEGTELSMQQNGVEKVRALRNHVAHNVIIDTADIDRMKYGNVVMEFSPSFWFPRPIIDAAEADLGPEMLQTVLRIGPILRSGVNVAIGSDWNQAQADPWTNLETLVTRRAPGDGPNGVLLGTDSHISLEQAIKAYTMGGAYAMFMEEEIGSIRPGKRANFIVLDRNLFDIPLNQIHGAVVNQTWFEGDCCINHLCGTVFRFWG